MENDHDILIELRADVKSLAADMTSIKDDNRSVLKDHEGRIRFIERYVWMAMGVIGAVEMIIGWYLIIHFNNR